MIRNAKADPFTEAAQLKRYTRFQSEIIIL